MLRHPLADRLGRDVNARVCYEVASGILGFFDAAEFSRRCQASAVSESVERLLDRLSFNGARRSSDAAAFLWSDRKGSYVFVGFDGAPKRRSASAAAGPARPSGDASGLRWNIAHARDVAQRLHTAFAASGPGIFGEHRQSQTLLPDGLVSGSREHLLFLTFTNCVNRARDALDLWRRCCGAWSNPATRYLFEPGHVQAAGLERVTEDLVRLKISRKHSIDCHAWYQIAKTLHLKWQDDPRHFVEACGGSAPTLIARLRADLTEGKPAYPLLRGAKIAPLWIRMLGEAGTPLSGMAEIPVAVDVHVLRATMCSGAITGRYSGRDSVLFDQVRALWQESVRDLRQSDGQPIVALDLDEALWTLSRSGCARRGNGPLASCPADCPLAGGCAEGVIEIHNGVCRLETRHHP